MKEITVIGERLNSSRKEVARALEQRDHSFIQREAQRQQENGAHYLDVNAGAFPEQEVELLSWLCEKVREVSPAPLCLDTTSPKAAEASLSRFPEKALLNGLTGEKPRLEAFVPLARSYGCGVIALCLDERGLPPDAEGA
ncbi:MAG: dihydropteroate synthase, partial [Chloroflexota bacterium]|nr:dihydropteroate synthase [Chloroflexota bacterium]